MALPEVNSERRLNLKRMRRESWRYIHTAKNGRKYYVSNLGRVKIVFTRGDEKILKQWGDGRNRYYRVRIEGYPFPVHRLVAIAFCKRRFWWYKDIDHRNGITTDNQASNLQWTNPKRNANNPITIWKRRYNFGTASAAEKPNPKHTTSFLTEEESRPVIERYITNVVCEYNNRASKTERAPYIAPVTTIAETPARKGRRKLPPPIEPGTPEWEQLRIEYALRGYPLFNPGQKKADAIREYNELLEELRLRQ